MHCPFPVEHLDELLADHEIRAKIDSTLTTLRALGLEPRPDVIRTLGALHDLKPDDVELVVALIGRRLSSLEGRL